LTATAWATACQLRSRLDSCTVCGQPVFRCRFASDVAAGMVPHAASLASLLLSIRMIHAPVTTANRHTIHKGGAPQIMLPNSPANATH
jgi:hypothetical protein